MLVEREGQALKVERLDVALEIIKQRLTIMAEEGNTCPNYMGITELNAFGACKYSGKHTEARMWLRRAHMHRLMVAGEDSPSVQKLARMLAQSVTAPPNPEDFVGV